MLGAVNRAAPAPPRAHSPQLLKSSLPEGTVQYWKWSPSKTLQIGSSHRSGHCMSQKTTPVPNQKSGMGFQDKVVCAFPFQLLELYIHWMQQVLVSSPIARHMTCYNSKENSRKEPPVWTKSNKTWKVSSPPQSRMVKSCQQKRTNQDCECNIFNHGQHLCSVEEPKMQQ